MSWYTDPQLFIHGYDTTFFIFRITKEFGIDPVVQDDPILLGGLYFEQYLSLGYNEYIDYAAFKATFPPHGNHKFVNVQGLVVIWNLVTNTGTWSREEPSSPFWRLPGIAQRILAGKQALEGKVSSLEEENKKIKKEKEDQDKTVSSLQEENKKIKKEKEDQDKTVSSLEDDNKIKNKDLQKYRLTVTRLQKQVKDLKEQLANSKSGKP